MSDEHSFIDLCEKIRFCDDVCRINNDPDASQRLKDFAARMRSEGLRITHGLTPKIDETLKKASRSLLLKSEPEAYIVSDPKPNAYAPIFGIKDQPLIVLTSGIVELLSNLELQYVIGHELGHLGFGHSAIPELQSYRNELDQLKKLSISRASEISSDRIGLIAVKSLTIAANVKIKLASGLSSNHLEPNIESFINQIKNDDGKISSEWELYRLHPSLPLRLWALIQFSKTAAYANLSGQGKTGISLEEADNLICEKLSELGDAKLSKMEQRYFDLAVTWLGTALVFDDEIIEEDEEKLLENLIGEELTQKALSFAKQHGLNSVLDKLQDAINRLDFNDVRIRNKLINTYDTFVRRANIRENQPKAYSVIKPLL